MRIVFTDLDGTLLGEKSYGYEAAQPALEALRIRRIPLVLTSSKTRAEMEFWRRRLRIQDPFIVENGGAILIPDGYFQFPLDANRRVNGHSVVELGCPHELLVEVLAMASLESGCRVLSFSEWNAEQISLRCGMPLEMAALAKQREYDEPFEIQTPDPAAHRRLLDAIKGMGFVWTRGGRFYHITGGNDKYQAVSMLIRYYQRAYEEVSTLGLGDGLNDAAFLTAVDHPVVIASRNSGLLQEAIPGARVTVQPGPAGWNRAVLDWLGQTALVQR